MKHTLVLLVLLAILVQPGFAYTQAVPSQELVAGAVGAAAGMSLRPVLAESLPDYEMAEAWGELTPLWAPDSASQPGPFGWTFVAGGGPFQLPDYGSENYYNTFHSADIDGDGVDELLGRGASGMEAYRFNAGTNTWDLVAGSGPFAPPGFDSELYYNTIHSGDIDGDGKTELLARGDNGVEAWRYDAGTQTWTFVAGGGPFQLPAYGSENYYNTFHSADIDGDGVDELLGRGDSGMEAYRFNVGTNTWDLVSGSGPFAPPGFNSALYYNTIHSGDIDGDGKAELLARGDHGMEAWRYDAGTQTWTFVAGGGPFQLPAYGSENYYNTFHSADIDGDGVDELLGRGASGMEAYRFNVGTNTWDLVAGGGPFAPSGFDSPVYYNTIHSGDIDGDGVDELLARGDAGVEAWRFGNRTITVLTYNTHLFGGSLVCFDWTPGAASCYEDWDRAWAIVWKVKGSGADIVALQEVWEQEPYDITGGEPEWIGDWQEKFEEELADWYPYAYHSNGNDCTSVVGSGLVLLSKWPLDQHWGSFAEFPAYQWCGPAEDCDYNCRKGVIYATVLVGVPPVPIRIGISHALTGQNDRKSIGYQFQSTAIAPFNLGGQTYVFSKMAEYDVAYLTQIEDYGYEYQGEPQYGAGTKHLLDDVWSDPIVESFELNGHPYLFSVTADHQASISRINDNPASGWQHLHTEPWVTSVLGHTVSAFELDGHPYLFALTADNHASIIRINDDPATGWQKVYTGPRDAAVVAVRSFELNGDPHLFTLKENDKAVLTRINHDQDGTIDPTNPFSDYEVDWDSSFSSSSITTFQLSGRPYIFGLRADGADTAQISRIDPDGEGFSVQHKQFYWLLDYPYIAVEALDLNGQPYLWALRDCCSQLLDYCLHARPRELTLHRLYEDQDGIELQVVDQLEDMKIIRDATVRDDLPAIMMGDLNVHGNGYKYGIMDSIFEKAGAIDTYLALHHTLDDDLDLVTGDLGHTSQVYLNYGVYDHAVKVNAQGFATSSWEQVGSDGPFAPPAFDSPVYYNTIHSGDIDGDGKAELLARGDNGMEAWRYDAGAQTWTPVAEDGPFQLPAYGSENYYNTFHSADIDGDGVDELLGRGASGMEAYRFNVGTNTWDLVSGSGPFAPPGFDSPLYYNTIHSGDIDGDGKAELLARGDHGMEAWRYDAGTHTWTFVAWDGPFQLPDYGSENYYNTFHSADIDGDGVDELLGRGDPGMEAYRFNVGTNTWDLVAGSGPFAPPGFDSPLYYNTIHSGDIDGDGKAELLARGDDGVEAWRYDAGRQTWTLVAGDGPFQLPAYGSENYYNTFHSADIDGDGADEVLGRGASGMEAWRSHFHLSVALGDMDGDGDLDLVAGRDRQANLLYLNNGTANPFDGVDSREIGPDSHDTTSVALGDVDGDGDLDLVAGNYGQASRLYLNNGTDDPFAGAQGSNISNDAHDTTSVALGDVNGDDHLDLVVGNEGQANRLYLNNGTPDPFAGVDGADIGAEPYSTTSVALGDMDGDGDLDLVEGNDGQANRLYLNNGTPDPFLGASGSAISADAHHTTSVALGDLNNDGHLDLVAGNLGEENRLYLNNGLADPFDGVGGSDTSPDAHLTTSVALGDLDNDGDLDLVAGNLGQANRLYRNNGTSAPFVDVSGLDIGAGEATRSVALGHLGWDAGETDDSHNNNLAPIFDGHGFSRLDYIYVKEQGTATRLIPTEATVIRDWTYYDPFPLFEGEPYRDLSDHYPLMATFRIEAIPQVLHVYLPLVVRSAP